jgi:DNA-binding MarR family transcriptional regulator
MTGLLRGLEADGFIERRPHPDDARSTIVTATDPARTALEDGRARRVRQLMRVVEPLTPPDRRSLERAVEALEASLSQAHERDPA